MANVCCSIELEPRTLKGGQLNHAREVAADVVEKLKPHEATVMFIEGLRPTGSIKKMKKITEEEEKEDHQVVGYMEKAKMIEIPCQCSCTVGTNISESTEQDKLREPLSAPF
ncbi:hypothetical protein L484_026261 [Morus notabilis]|uniref:Uncharacterized protein n=1 Tax=Morus notabilis TaxID=981085 RepID=W9REI8_9ROSA|nr:uncharacterized protein LOC21408924 [Morus notabilis]EXB74564.1 hypothetical protein L484_026261 [Morus notabilis]